MLLLPPLLLLLSHFSRVRLCATPQTAGHQAVPSLGFSRQEHWSGLPFPSPVHESEKWKWKWSCSVMSDSPRSHGPQPTRLLHPWDFPGKRTGVVCNCLLRYMNRTGPKFSRKQSHSRPAENCSPQVNSPIIHGLVQRVPLLCKVPGGYRP